MNSTAWNMMKRFLVLVGIKQKRLRSFVNRHDKFIVGSRSPLINHFRHRSKYIHCFCLYGMGLLVHDIPDSKVHGVNMGPTWVLSAPDVGPMNFATRDNFNGGWAKNLLKLRHGWLITPRYFVWVLSPIHGPLVRYVKLRIVQAPGMPGTFSPPPTSKETASQRSRHASRHVRDARAVIANPLWRENGIPGACATRNFTYMARDPWSKHNTGFDTVGLSGRHETWPLFDYYVID